MDRENWSLMGYQYPFYSLIDSKFLEFMKVLFSYLEVRYYHDTSGEYSYILHEMEDV